MQSKPGSGTGPSKGERSPRSIIVLLLLFLLFLSKASSDFLAQQCQRCFFGTRFATDAAVCGTFWHGMKTNAVPMHLQATAPVDVLMFSSKRVHPRFSHFIKATPPAQLVASAIYTTVLSSLVAHIAGRRREGVQFFVKKL